LLAKAEQVDSVPLQDGLTIPAEIARRRARIEKLQAARAVIDLEKLGQRTIWIDCDVLEADGGTRTAAITGAYVAVALAVQKLLALALIKESPLRAAVAAISVGIVDGLPLLDLCYEEDVKAAVDMNVVMTDTGQSVEVQGTGEEAPFTKAQLHDLLQLGEKGITKLIAAHEKALR